MLPELAVAYVSGWIPALSLSIGHAWLARRKFQSRQVQQLQSNLQQVGLYWSESAGRKRSLTESSPQEDLKAYLRSVWISAVLFFLLSWIGFVLNLLLMVSLRFLAVPREERVLFHSPLVERPLTPNEVATFLDQATT